ncbi:MAG: alpha/beta hydrolase [Candidatus Latescibacterota bacterium]|nr:MAG: alpha/beta hydrolase [Candidatus Latescibacterota bacterium]
MISRLTRFVFSFVAVLGAVVIVLVYVDRERTPGFRSEEGKDVPGSVAVLEKVTLGGLDQSVLIRGKDNSSPVVLFLHGGPGMPMMYLAHQFQRGLEDAFVTVQWDQRGAGKSYSRDVSVETMNVRQFMSDARELIDHLRDRFDHKKVFLVGHSWGSYLGMLLAHRHPDLFHAYIGVGQVTNPQRAREIQARFIRKRALEEGREDAIAELDSLGVAVHEKWLFEFGGELYESTSWIPFLLVGLRSPEYTIFDCLKIAPGSNFSSAHMEYNVINGPLMEEVATVDVPVYFFMGRHDYATPAELANQYLDSIEAPAKTMVWFEKSAHFPFFEEPEEFAEQMKRVLSEVQ